MNLTKTTDAEKDWKGFTLDELRYQRAYSAAKSEISKERLIAAFGSLTSGEKNPGLSEPSWVALIILTTD